MTVWYTESPMIAPGLRSREPIAERWLSDHYNRPGNAIFDHCTYAIASDCDLQEGVASEAASLAGTLRLGKLIYLYDDNDISIEGSHVLRVGALRRFEGGSHRHIPLWSVGPRWDATRRVRPDSPTHGG